MNNKTNALFLGVTALASAGCKAEAPAIEQHPNIIFVLTDDQRWDALGYAGNPYIKTPNLDKLASQGVYFQNTYATTAISCASRASIFSGMYASHSGIHDFKTNFTPEQYAETYPQLLREAGYFTGFIGKYGVGQQFKDNGTFDYWKSFPGQGWYYNEKKGQTEHLTSIQGKQILEFLDSASVSEKPFALQVSFKAPHCQDEMRAKNGEEFPIDPRDAHLYDGVVFPVPENGSDEDYMALNSHFRYADSKGKENEARVRWRYRFDTPEKYQNTVRKYYSLISGVDREVGNMMAALEEKGLDKNTIIIFMGDNGYYLGEHGLAGKWYGHEESARLPMFIYDPRAPKARQGVKENRIALNIDMAPTILSLAGVEIPACMDGEDLSPILRGENPAWRSDFYYEHRYNPEPVHIPLSEGVINEDYKLIHYVTDNTEWWEMFDLRQDKQENHNIYNDPQHAEAQAALMARFHELNHKITGAE